MQRFGKLRIEQTEVLLSNGTIAKEFTLFRGKAAILHSCAPKGTTTGSHEKSNKLSTIPQVKLDELSKMYRKSGLQSALDKKLEKYNSDVSLPLSSLYYQLHHKSSSWTNTPYIISNMIGGKGHHGFGPDFTELMILVKAPTSRSSIRLLSLIYDQLRLKIITKYGVESVMSGAEGAFSPRINNEQALDLIDEVLATHADENISIAIDAAAVSLCKDEKKLMYEVDGKLLNSAELVAYYSQLCTKYPRIAYLEDGFHPRDKEGWRSFVKWSKLHRPSLLIVGDDITATHSENIRNCRELINAVICKPDQVGTVSGFLDACVEAKKYGKELVVSQRSIENDDPSLLELAMDVDADGIKLGTPARERIVKYNQLFREMPLVAAEAEVGMSIDVMQEACEDQGAKLLVRGSSAYGASFINEWSDIDVSILFEKLSIEKMRFVRQLYSDHRHRSPNIKLSITPFDKLDTPSINPLHHHGIKPITYTIELAQQFEDNPYFLLSHGNVGINYIQADTLYRYYEMYYKMLADYYKSDNRPQVIAEAWHRLARMIRSCLEILNSELIPEKGKINEFQQYDKLPFAQLAAEILNRYQTMRAAWTEMGAMEKVESQEIAVGFVIELHHEFIKTIGRLGYGKD